MITRTLLTVGNRRFTMRHLLVIGVLCASFSISFMLRAQSAEYGLELHEFDPFFNYRATEFLLENGSDAYFAWHDDLSWHPDGRNVSASSQVMQHFTAAAAYQAFGGGSSLYDFTIVMPAVLGSLTAIVMFALVRVVAGTSAGLFASLLFSMSLPIMLRGALGWFKSEPLGIFYGLLGIYLLVSGIRTEDRRIAMAKMLGAGIMLGFGLASWGGVQFFVMPLGVFFLALPFLRKNLGFLTAGIPVFAASVLLIAAMFERPGTDFALGLGGFSLLIPTVFLVACGIIHWKSRPEKRNKYCMALLLAVIVAGPSLLAINEEAQFMSLPSFRYLNAINPFLTTTNALSDSVSEHSTTSIVESFFFHSILMIFAGLGAWLLIGRRTGRAILPADMAGFALIMGLLGVYVSSAFIRLEVFASISVIILSSVGLSVLLREILGNRSLADPVRKLRNRAVKGSFLAVIMLLVMVPFLMPANANWMTMSANPPVILNGGTFFVISTNDWPESLEWMKHNTPEDSVIAAWWDYGYWISTVSERTTLADNATIDSDKIERMARMFISTPDDAWAMLQQMDADYVLVFVAGERLHIPDQESYYMLDGGGDESKMSWFIRIAGDDTSKYLRPDGTSPTDHFWNETLLGHLFPFSVKWYVDFESNLQMNQYRPGTTPVYVADVKYPADDPDGPFRLVHASPGYLSDRPGPMLGVFIYEINHEYSPAAAP